MKKMANTVKVIIRNERVDAQGKSPLYLQFFVNKERKRIALDAKIEVEKFDVDFQRVKGKSDEAQRINALISKKMARANEIFFEAYYNNESLTMSKFFERFDNSVSKDSYSDFVKAEVLKSNLSKGTQNKHLLTHRYMSECLSKQNILFADIDLDFVEKCEKDLKKDLNLDTNTRFSHHKNVKKCLNLATAKGKRVEYPYKNYKVKKAKTNPTWLTAEEVDLLFKVYNSKTLSIENQRVLRYFLFSCVCGGLRISDLKTLEDSHKIGDNLVFRALKTHDTYVQIVVPFSEVGLALWRDDISRDKTKFGCLSDYQSNRIIKNIARRVGIEKNVTMRVARDTFGTNYVIFGGNVVMLQDILSHSKIETTMIYVRIAEAFKQKNEQMRNFDRFFKVEKRRATPVFKIA